MIFVARQPSSRSFATPAAADIPPGLRAAGSAPKAFRAGTHRTRAPEATLANVLPLATRMGITRIGTLTGLDTLGIPVCMACRPNSRSLAVFQGKGLSLAAAKASALMEAAETYHAETLEQPLRLADYGEIRAHSAAVDPGLLPRQPLAQVDPYGRLLWMEGRDLASGMPVWVPYETVGADYVLPLPHGTDIFAASTNGLGAGNHILEAVAHGLYEVVERDAVALWRLGGATARAARRLDPVSITSPPARDLITRFERVGIRLALWDATSDIEIPVFVCLAIDDTVAGGAGTDPEFGTGCHPDREVALLRAITEAAQARTTFISGARDDFDPAAYDGEARRTRAEVARRWSAGPASRDWRAAPSFAGEEIEHDLAEVLARLLQRGIDRVVWVDLTKPELGLPAARVVVPGLEPPHQISAIPGLRARRVIEAAAQRRAPLMRASG
jgi:ribosomal protein S12 methylthiotransferase accessory factor